MNRFLFLLSILFFNTYLFAQPAGYYDAATGTGYALKTQLHNIIDGHNSQTYDALWTHMQTTDADNYYENDGSVLDMYSENPIGADPYNFTWITDQCGNYSGENSCYNREHSFPKSWFNDGYPMYTDLFHLYPTDGYVNGQRNNFPFGEVDPNNYDWISLNGSLKGTCVYPGYTGTVFEPIDEFKGDFARTYFYMATRYENVVSGWSSPMLDGSTNQVYEDWALSMLLEWHANDPVSQKEIDRNNAVYGIQDNRNPFIDHPEWVNSIWGGGTENPEPDNQPTSFTATLNGVNQIDLSWIDAAGTNLPTGYLIKANTTGSFTPPADGTDPSEDSNLADGSALVKVAYGNESYSFLGLNSETTYYFKVWAYANMGATIDFKLDGTVPTGNATTLVAPVVINSEDFSSCPGTWTSVSVAGSADWTCDATNLYAGINAYGADVASDDYLISPEINLDAYSNEVFTFDSWTKYNDTYYPPIELLYTTNYTGDPSTTTWQTLNPTWAAENSEMWTASGDVSLSGISGASVYLAFRYTSSGTGGGSSSIWDIDNIFLTGYESGPNLAVSPSFLTDFTYEEGLGASASQSFTLSGEELDGSEITITAPTNFEVSLDNSAFSTTKSISYTAPTLSNTTVYVRLKAGLTDGTYNNENVTLSDNGAATNVTVSCSGSVTLPPVATLTVAPTSLSGYAYVEGTGPSASQSFELSGSDLDGSSVSITAPTNYEISTNNTTFSSTETVAYTSPTLNATAIYVRLKAGLTAGTYNNENVILSDNGSAATVTVGNSGAVSSGGGAGACEDFENYTAASYYTGTVELSSGTWDFTSVYPETLAHAGSKAVRLNDDITDANITSPAFNTVGTVSFWYRPLNEEVSTFDLQKSVDGGAFTTIDSYYYGSSQTYVEYTFDVNESSSNVKIRIVNNNQLAHLIIDDFCVTSISGSSPILTVSPTTLNGFAYEENSGPSASQSFTLSGSDLDGSSITLTAPENYELSLDNSTFAATETVSYTAPTLGNTSVYVRLKTGLTAGTYNNENVTCADNGSAASVTVSNNGEVTAALNPVLTVSPTTLNGFAYEENSGPSASQSFTLSGSDLDGSSITLTAPENYELSLDNSTFAATETVSYTAPTLNNTTIYVRLKAGLAAGTYNNENVTCADNGSAASVTVSNNGEVTAALNPVLTVSPTTLNGFTYEENSGPSASQSFTLSGSDLDGSSITLTAPENYELSLDNSTFAATETVSYTAPTLGNTTVYVRLKAGLTAGTYNNENVTCADNGSAASVTVSNNGEVTAALNPVLTVSPTTLNGFTYEENSGPSASQSFTLSGSDLDGSSITLTAPENYELSLDNSTFAAIETVSYAAPTLNNTTIYVRLKAGLTAGTYNNENVTCADNGSAASVTVSNNGEVTAAFDPVPDNYPTNFVVSAFDDTQMDLTWTDATGTNLPTGYLLKASTDNQLDDPVNGIEPDEDSDLSDGEALVLLPYGTITHRFEGLSESTTYYFKIWSFANTGNAILFKTDGAVPAASATTEGIGIMNKSGLETELLVFPNPADNQLFIELTGSSFVQIYTMQGVLEYEQQMQNSAEIDVRDFNKGIYLLKVQGIDTDWQRLVVIE